MNQRSSTWNYWQQVENYLAVHTDVRLSHGICPDCYGRVEAEIRAIDADTQSPA